MKKHLLIHTCCAPCLSVPLEVLVERFDGAVTAFFYNPNIDTSEEYYRRAEAVADFIGRRYPENVALEVPPYDSSPFEKDVLPLAGTGERGERCTVCYAMRLRHSFEEARRRRMTHVATTLTVSPHKDRKRIDCIGSALEAHYGIAYLTGVWDEKRSRELCCLYGIYRQNYCGCAASAVERDQRRRKGEEHGRRE